MQTYRRFVSYVYQYENGKKAGNRGFVKVEARGNTCTMQISLKGICRDGNGSCKVYGFKREEGLLKGSLLAVCPVKTGLVQEQLGFLRNEMGEAKYSLHDLSGVIFRGDDETMYGTQWDDAPMKMENFQPDEKHGSAENDLEDREREIGKSRDEPPLASMRENADTAPSERILTESEAGGAEMRQPDDALASVPAAPESVWPKAAEQGMPEDTPRGAVQESVSERASGSEGPEKMEPEDTETGGAENILWENTGDDIEPDGEVHIQEDRKMPPKDTMIPTAEGPGSGGISAELPESGATAEMPKPQKNEYIPMPEIPDRPEEEKGLPDILDTTVPIPGPEKETPQDIAEDNDMEDHPMGNDVMEEGIMENDIIESGIIESGITENDMAGNNTTEGDITENDMAGNGTMENDIPEKEAARDNTVQISATEHGASGSTPDMEAERTSFCPFTDGVLEDCRKISMDDLRFLDPRDQGMRSNRFVQHGYQMFGHLLLARVSRNSQYILGVPGMYQKQERFMADMHGFHNFKCAGRKGDRPVCFGYWYRLIYPPKLDRRDKRAH